MAKFNLSLHPKLAAATEGIASSLLMVWLHAIGAALPLLMWAVARLAVWLLLVLITYYPPGFSRKRHAATLGYFFCGSTLLLLFIEWAPAWYAIAALTAVGSLVSFGLIPESAPQSLSFIFKPWRRWRLMMATVSFMGLSSGLFAMQALQIIAPLTWWVPLVIGALAAATSAWWWWEYELPLKKFFRPALVLGVVLSELSAVISFLPSGYFAAALLVTWLWYVLLLMLRFYQTNDGINWRKQGPFLGLSGLLVAGYLGLLRWH
jgi:hypothetical protein